MAKKLVIVKVPRLRTQERKTTGLNVLSKSPLQQPYPPLKTHRPDEERQRQTELVHCGRPVPSTQNV